MTTPPQTTPPQTTPQADDLLVLLDEQRRPSGIGPRLGTHGTSTPLHLAFSCYVFSPEGHLLMTRRALTKLAWPGVWTNSCCGHPRPGEPIPDAIVRRLDDELGLTVTALECVLPDFQYRASDPAGIEENEFCPVFVARTTRQPVPSPAEVAEYRWTDWSAVVDVARQAPWLLSPWAALQIPLLEATRTADAGAPTFRTVPAPMLAAGPDPSGKRRFQRSPVRP